MTESELIEFGGNFLKTIKSYIDNGIMTPNEVINLLDRPTIHMPDGDAAKKLFISHYIETATPDDIVVIPGGAALCHIEGSQKVYIEPRASLCMKNEYGCNVVIGLYDSTAEAEAARLQFIHDYIDKKDDFEL